MHVCTKYIYICILIFTLCSLEYCIILYMLYYTLCGIIYTCHILYIIRYYNILNIHCTQVTLVAAMPIKVTKWVETNSGPIPQHVIDDLHSTYISALSEVFNQYKAVAGYPDAVLEIV